MEKNKTKQYCIYNSASTHNTAGHGLSKVPYPHSSSGSVCVCVCVWVSVREREWVYMFVCARYTQFFLLAPVGTRVVPWQVFCDADSQEPKTIHLLHHHSTDIDRGVCHCLLFSWNQRSAQLTLSSRLFSVQTSLHIRDCSLGCVGLCIYVNAWFMCVPKFHGNSSASVHVQSNSHSPFIIHSSASSVSFAFPLHKCVPKQLCHHTRGWVKCWVFVCLCRAKVWCLERATGVVTAKVNHNCCSAIYAD